MAVTGAIVSEKKVDDAFANYQQSKAILGEFDKFTDAQTYVAISYRDEKGIKIVKK